jgi:L-fuconolactonase
MDGAGVDRAVIVPPSWEGDRNDLALEAAQSDPQRYAVMGRIDPEDARARSELSAWKSYPGMLGIRLTFHTPLLLPPLTEGRLEWFWPAAERAGIAPMILVPHSLLYVVDAIAERYPRLRIIMDHLALTMGMKDGQRSPISITC